jgi:hypothetical protein
VSETDEEGRLRRVADYAEQKAQLERWRADPHGMRARFRAVADGGPADIEALLWADLVVHVAGSAAFKLWTMYVRGETQRKAELDRLISTFRGKDWR